MLNTIGTGFLCCVVFIIIKIILLSYRILDVTIRGLRNASPFAKDIITGRRPTNTSTVTFYIFIFEIRN